MIYRCIDFDVPKQDQSINQPSETGKLQHLPLKLIIDTHVQVDINMYHEATRDNTILKVAVNFAELYFMRCNLTYFVNGLKQISWNNKSGLFHILFVTIRRRNS